MRFLEKSAEDNISSGLSRAAMSVPNLHDFIFDECRLFQATLEKMRAQNIVLDRDNSHRHMEHYLSHIVTVLTYVSRNPDSHEFVLSQIDVENNLLVDDPKSLSNGPELLLALQRLVQKIQVHQVIWNNQ